MNYNSGIRLFIGTHIRYIFYIFDSGHIHMTKSKFHGCTKNNYLVLHAVPSNRICPIPFFLNWP